MNVFDVAKFFLSKSSMTNKKIQKLCYYAQGWYSAFYKDEKLFDEKIEAWVHGPVCPELYKEYADYGFNEIPKIDEDIYMQEKEKNILEQIWDIYGKYGGDQLEILTHREEPWINARQGLDRRQPSNQEILPETMGSYYRKRLG